MIKRLSGLDLAVSDLHAAIAVLQRNFGLKLCRITSDTEAELTIGEAGIRLIAKPQTSTPPTSVREGMVGLWLEAQDVEALAESLARAGVKRSPLKIAHGRRVLEITPAGFAEPWLFIFDKHG
jgi:hypothetical protein